MNKITPQRSTSGSNGTKKLSLPSLIVLAIMLLNVMVPMVSARSKLKSNDLLKTGQYLDSPDGSKRFVVEGDKAVIYQKGIRDLQTWSLKPEGGVSDVDSERYSLSLTSRGYLVAYNTRGEITRRIITRWGEKTEGKWEVSLGNNGILYLKDPKGVIRWNNICDSIQTFLEPDWKFMGACLISPDSRTFLHMQRNGNLVIYKGYTPVRSYSQLYNTNNGVIYLDISRTGTLSIKKHSEQTGIQHVIYNNDKPGVKEDTYRVSITNDARIRIEDSKGNRVALI